MHAYGYSITTHLLSYLTSTTSNAMIKHLKSIFARRGLPQVIVSDNGPQYSSTVFTEFAKQYDFTHITRSPQFFLKQIELQNVLYAQ